MSPRGWIAKLEGADPSVPLALAALVGAADLEGRAGLDALLLGYREGYLRVYRPAEGLGDSVRDHVASSALPRLATDGWIQDGSGDGWSAVVVAGAWWPEARLDRQGTMADLLALAERAAGLVSPPRA